MDQHRRRATPQRKQDWTKIPKADRKRKRKLRNRARQKRRERMAKE